MSSRLLDRHIRSWCLANIILDLGLFDEYKIWRYNHPKVKSNYRAGNLFLLNKKKRYYFVAHPVPVNMDTLDDYYYE